MRAIGVDIGGTSVRAAVVDAHGSILDTARAATPSSQDALEDAIVATVHELTRKHRVEAIGLAVAGFIRADRARVLFAPHLAWRDTDIAGTLGARIGLPVLVEHDTNAAALAEHRFGAARGDQVTVFLSLGTGIGAALVVGGSCSAAATGSRPNSGICASCRTGAPVRVGRRVAGSGTAAGPPCPTRRSNCSPRTRKRRRGCAGTPGTVRGR